MSKEADPLNHHPKITEWLQVQAMYAMIERMTITHAAKLEMFLEALRIGSIVVPLELIPQTSQPILETHARPPIRTVSGKDPFQGKIRRELGLPA